MKNKGLCRTMFPFEQLFNACSLLINWLLQTALMPYSHIYAHVTGWDGIRRAVLNCCGREGAVPNAFDLLSNLHLWWWALGSDGKNEIADTSIQNDFLPQVGCTHTRGEKKLLLLYAKRNQLRWLRHLIRMSLVDTFLRFTRHVQPVGDPELPWGITYLILLRNASGSPRTIWKICGREGIPFSACCHRDPALGGWMDGFVTSFFVGIYTTWLICVHWKIFSVESYIYIYKSQNTSVNPSVCIDSNQDLTDPVSFGRRRQHKPEWHHS